MQTAISDSSRRQTSVSYEVIGTAMKTLAALLEIASVPQATGIIIYQHTINKCLSFYTVKQTFFIQSFIHSFFKELI